MLFDYDGKRMDHVPHQEEFEQRRKRIAPEAYAAIFSAVNLAVEHKDSFHALWLSDAVTNELQASLVAAAGPAVRDSWAFFGQIVWEVLRNRQDEWVFFQPPNAEGEFGGNYYFRRNPGESPRKSNSMGLCTL